MAIQNKKSKEMPAITPEARVQQVAAAAMDLAEQKIRDGTASSQLITTILKMSSPKERLEKEQLERQIVLLEARTKAIENMETNQELYKSALEAMSMYKGESKADVPI